MRGVTSLVARWDGGDEREALDAGMVRKARLVSAEESPQDGGELELQRGGHVSLAALVLRKRG